MPQGKGTYGNKVGRPPKKVAKKVAKAGHYVARGPIPKNPAAKKPAAKAGHYVARGPIPKKAAVKNSYSAGPVRAVARGPIPKKPQTKPKGPSVAGPGYYGKHNPIPKKPQTKPGRSLAPPRARGKK